MKENTGLEQVGEWRDKLFGGRDSGPILVLANKFLVSRSVPGYGIWWMRNTETGWVDEPEPPSLNWILDAIFAGEARIDPEGAAEQAKALCAGGRRPASDCAVNGGRFHCPGICANPSDPPQMGGEEQAKAPVTGELPEGAWGKCEVCGEPIYPHTTSAHSGASDHAGSKWWCKAHIPTRKQEEGVTASPSAPATPKNDSAGTVEEAVEAPVVGEWLPPLNGHHWLYNRETGILGVVYTAADGAIFGVTMQPTKHKESPNIEIAQAWVERKVSENSESPATSEAKNRGGGESLPVLPDDGYGYARLQAVVGRLYGLIVREDQGVTEPNIPVYGALADAGLEGHAEEIYGLVKEAKAAVLAIAARECGK